MSYTPPPSSVSLSSLNWKSASFWSALAGIAAIVCGALKVDQSWTSWIQAAFIGVGGLLVAIPSHHIVKAQVAANSGAPPTNP